jgi:hypothetical protein
MTAENMRRDLRDNVAEIADRARDLSAGKGSAGRNIQ